MGIASQKPALVIPLEFPEVLNLPPLLVEQLGAANALAFARLTIEQVLRQILPLDDDYRAYIMYQPRERTRDLQDWLAWTRGRAVLEWNEGATEVERMAHALTFALDDGAALALLVKPTCLALRRSRIEEIFRGLLENDVVIGPTPMGDVYALGTRTPLPLEILANAYAANGNRPVALAKQLATAGLECAMLDDAPCVLTPADLGALPEDIRSTLPTKFCHALALLGIELT
ncbi:MAG: DUF2064 domain-containing protein [Candidatus Sumerlaeaceae bacterium]